MGKGIAAKLEANHMYTMGDIARRSTFDEDVFYKLFGVNAELLIDHAWGWEPCTIADIKAYKPENHSVSQGQVLSCPYDFDKARLIVREMTELLVLDLVDKGLVCDQIVLTVGYDIENTKNGNYTGEIKPDRYGRDVPKQAHGSENIGRYTSSTKLIVEATMRLFDRIVDKNLTVRRMYVVANHVITESDIPETHEQLDLFSDFESVEEKRKQEDAELEREKELQKAMIALQKRFGKNSVLKGLNFKEGATTIERNSTIGGHKA